MGIDVCICFLAINSIPRSRDELWYVVERSEEENPNAFRWPWRRNELTCKGVHSHQGRRWDYKDLNSITEVRINPDASNPNSIKPVSEGPRLLVLRGLYCWCAHPSPRSAQHTEDEDLSGIGGQRGTDETY